MTRLGIGAAQQAAPKLSGFAPQGALDRRRALAID